MVGRILLEEARPEDAISALEEAVELLPKEFFLRCCGPERSLVKFGLYRTLGDARMSADQPAQAADAYRDHLKLDPGDRRTWTRLMRALARAGRLEELERFGAERVLILSAYPRDQQLRAALQRILAGILNVEPHGPG